MTTETDISTGFRRLADALRDVGLSARRCAEAFGGCLSAIEALWAVMPGEWPDNFTLLNRYLRTGVKPPYLFNE